MAFARTLGLRLQSFALAEQPHSLSLPLGNLKEPFLSWAFLPLRLCSLQPQMFLASPLMCFSLSNRTLDLDGTLEFFWLKVDLFHH
jgi:hypothetical protein